MTILVTGGTGQVGFELQRALAPLGQIDAPPRNQLELLDPAAVNSYLKARNPGLIVNAAAYTAVDRAESEPETAHTLNARLPQILAEYAADKGVWMIHYSSDYVYPGGGDAPWSETDAPGPLSVYGQTKLDGDVAIQNSGADHLIFRTSWVYSARGHNFMKTMLRLGAEKETLSIVNDQHGSPTPARLIAQVTALALYRVLTDPTARSAQGIYHLAPRGTTTWQDFASAIFQMASEHGLQLKIDPTQINGMATQDYPTPATRPLNSRLAIDKSERTFGLQLPDWRQQLHQTIAESMEKVS